MNKLEEIQQLINGLEIGWLLDNRMNLTELGLFVNRVEKIIQRKETVEAEKASRKS